MATITTQSPATIPPVIQPITWRTRGIYIGIAGAAVLLFVCFGATGTGQPGFPLDDGWIHQTFARALAWRGEWAYNPGHPVAGSTSPLWTLLLTPPYFLWRGTAANPVDGGGLVFFLGWAYLLGALSLGVAAAETDALARRALLRIWPDAKATTVSRAGWAAGLLSLLEWRLVWAAASGMETLLFIALMLWLLRRGVTLCDRIRAGQDVPALPYAGLGVGLLALVRPEGAALAAFLAADIILAHGPAHVMRWLKSCLVLALGFALPVVPYALFNLALSGSPLPTTFYAKSSAYAAANIGGVVTFLLSPDPAQGGIAVLLFGPLLLLVPGALAGWIILGRTFAGRYGRLFSFVSLWPVALLLLYALRLPVTYQHGRYLMPLIPFVIAWGVAGYCVLLRWLRSVRLPKVARVVPVLIALGWLYAGFSGLRSYYYDVKFFNWNEMQVGRWLRDNAPPGAAVATHDIGAIGYFAGYGAAGDTKGHIIVDTAGLVSPAYVPIVRDEMAIRRQLAADHVLYLAMLPDWYATLGPQLDKEGRLAYTPQPADLGLPANVNMRVYRMQ